MVDVKYILRRDGELARVKQPWMTLWQIVAEYVMTSKASFTSTISPGEMLNKDLYDATASKNCSTTAASLVSALWPSGGNSFRFQRPQNIPSTKEVEDYYIWAHKELASDMDDPEAGLDTTLEEYMRDEVAFGTSGIAVYEGEKESTFLFQPYSVKCMKIAEDANGRVDTVYYDIELDVLQTVTRYGVNNVSAKTRELYSKQKFDDKVKILLAIQPRLDIVPGKAGNQNMPWEAVHIEVEQKHVLRESGFEDMAVLVGRIMKNIGEQYGRSPAMEALPDILELNAIREAEIVATEKILDPPLGVLDDGKLGGTIIDTSAGAINVFNISGRMGNQQPIFPLFTVGDLKPVKERIEELKESLSDHFFIDRLLDLNNETPMTLGEAQLRDKLRGMTLGGLFKRQIVEIFNPLIRRCFNIKLRKGQLGVIPGSWQHQFAVLNGEEPKLIPEPIVKAMLRGEDVYNIQYLTPAQRMMEAEVAQGIINAWKFANEVIATRPEAADYLNEDESIKVVAPLLGAPRSILRDDKTVEGIRKVRAEMQQAQAQQQNELVKAEIVAKYAKAMPKQADAGQQLASAGAMI